MITVVFASFAVLGITSFIAQRLKQNVADELYLKCIYLAQAGIHNAVYFYRDRDISGNGYFSLGRTDIDASNYFVLGGTDADMLMVNTRTTDTGGTGQRDLLNLRLQKATNSKNITIDRMVVSWNNSRTIRIIRIGGTNRWTGTLSSPADCDLPANFSLTSTSTVNVNYIRFSGNMNNAQISIQFVMTDGSSKTVSVLPQSQQFNFTVKATGKTGGSGLYRTIEAEYNAATQRIADYEEINAEVTP